jgi:hypothetical protein
MQIREHHGFGHGLRPGTTEDINCPSCKHEKAEGQEPRIHEDGQPWAGEGFTRRNEESTS